MEQIAALAMVIADTDYDLQCSTFDPYLAA